MSNGFPWRTALKIAWRESRASSAKFLFVVLAVAVGVGSLTGVRGFSRAFRTMLLRDARTLMAADLSVRVFELPNDAQKAELDSLERRGVARTWITETVSMMAAPSSADPVLVSVKAVDPARYPFYGEVKLDPPGRLQDRLKDGVVLVSEDLSVRMGIKAGDRVKLGSGEFSVGGVVMGEPDRMAGSLNVGPRAMINRLSLEATGLMQPGSRAAQRHLLRLPLGGPGVAKVRLELQKAFPDAMIADFRETHPLVTRGLDRATMFLSLVSLIALIVGAIGVAMAMQSHLQQKLDSIAVMKSLGARSSQIIRIYTLQATLLALAGGAAGVPLGGAVQYVFPWLIGKYFAVNADFGVDWISAVEGFVAALLVTLLFTVPALLGIRRIRPNVILRREMAETGDGETRWRRLRAPAAAAAVILAGICAVAAWLIGGDIRDAARVGAWFAGGLLVSLLVMAALSWLLLRGLRGVSHSSLPPTLRHGIANLYRPGNHAQAALIALSIGVMFTLTVYLVQHSVIQQMMASAPPGMPNVFLINITEKERAPLEEFLKKAPGVEGSPEMRPAVAARVVRVDGVPIEARIYDGPARRFRRARGVTWSAKSPPQTQIVAGAWWTTFDPASPQVSVSEEAAHLLKVKPGSKLDFSVSDRPLTAVVAAFHKTEAVRPGSNVEFIFTPGSLHGVSVLYYGGVRVRGREVGALQRDAFKLFPSVTVINVADVLDRVQEVVDQIALVIRFISAFSILAGMIILASSVAGTRFRRIREVVILKTLGATRRRVAGIFSVEFLVLGVVAGVMGSLLATGFSSLLLKRLFEVTYRYEPLPNAAAVVLTALVANAAGWLASYRILNQKPLEALRDE